MADRSRLTLSWREVSGHASESVLRTLTRAAGVTLLLIASLCVVVRATQPKDTASLAADVAVVTAFVTIAVRMLMGHLRVVEIGGLMAVGVAAAVMAPDSALGQFAVPATTTNVLLALVVTLEPAPALTLGTLATIGTVLVRCTWAHVPLDFAVHMAVLQTGMLLAAVVVVASVFKSVRTSDALAADLHAAAEQSQIQQADYRSRETIRRVLHDDVLTALRGLAEPISPHHEALGSNAGLMRNACREATAVIRNLTQDGTSDGDLNAAREATRQGGAAHAASRIVQGLALSVSLDLREGSAPPPDVEEALVQSAREALRNVRRHAGTLEAVLDVDYSSTPAAVAVRDHGVGFLAKRVPHGIGITSSIVSRMEHVGGSATLTSQPGHGSSWLLQGPVPVRSSEPDGSAGDDQPATAGFLTNERRRLAWGVTVPLLVANVWLASFFIPRDAQPGAEAAVAIAMTCTTVFAAARLARARPSRRVVAFFAVLQPALLLVHMWGAGPGAAGDFRSWGAAFGALPLVVVAFFVPSRRALAALVLPYAAALVLVVAFDSASAFASSFGFITAFVGVVISWVLGAGLRRSWQRVEGQRHRVHLARVEERRRVNLESIKGQYLGHVVTTVLPFLDDVATGRLKVGDPSVRQGARLLTVSTRDDLYAPGFYSPSMRRKVDDYRAAGGVLDIRAGVPAECGRDAEDVLRRLVNDRSGQRRIIVSHHSGTPDRIDPGTRIVVLPALSETELTPLIGSSLSGATVVENDSYTTVLHLPTLLTSGDGSGARERLEKGDEC